MPDVTMFVKITPSATRAGMVAYIADGIQTEFGRKEIKSFIPVYATLTDQQVRRFTERYVSEARVVGDHDALDTVVTVDNIRAFNATPGEFGHRIRFVGEHGTIDGLEWISGNRVDAIVRTGGAGDPTGTLTLRNPIGGGGCRDGCVVLARDDQGNLLPGGRQHRRKYYRRLRIANLMTAQQLADARDPLIDSPVLDLRASSGGPSTAEWAARAVHHYDTPRNAEDL